MKDNEEERQTERVDNAFILLSDTVHTTDPLATITERADTLNAMRASEGRDEKVPWKK
jgi:hypothetical protein